MRALASAVVPRPLRAPLLRVLRASHLVPPVTEEADDDHPERIAVLRHVAGTRVLEVGCGHRKSASSFIGVDLVPGGQRGTTGNAAGRLSQADVGASGERLPFPSRSFGTVVARHNLEHYVDLVEVLDEWARVLADGGRLVLVVPDEARYPGRTVELDPTHHHSFTESSLRRLLERLGWRVGSVGPCIEGWSLLVVAERLGRGGGDPGDAP